MVVSGLEPRSRTLAELGLRPEQLPRHIAIIMDGNGRWANQRGYPRVMGHRRGVFSVRSVTEECCRLGIEQLTLYCLSVDNWKRPQRELDQLMSLLEQYLIQERPTLMKQSVRLQVIGRREQLPAGVVREMDKSISMTANNHRMTLNLAINYGGRSEIVDAARSLARQAAAGALDPEEIDENTFADMLYTRGMPDPDLLIRTAGELRVSNFLLWQISYAELWVADVCWPDFGPAELHRALVAYAARERRYGGLNG